MKGIKELQQLALNETAEVTVDKTNQDTSYCRKNKYHAFAAAVFDTKQNGSVLAVYVFSGNDNSNRKHKIQLDIAERHFLNEKGEVYSERYERNSGTLTAKKGTFTITTSDVETWEVQTEIASMCRQSRLQYFIPLEDADKVIINFAKKHKLFRTVSPNNFSYISDEKQTFTSGVCWFAAYQRKIKYEKSEEAKCRREQRTVKRMEQIDDDLPQDFLDWIENEKLSEAPWFYYFEKRVAKGICGRCEAISEIESGVKNEKKGVCPACGNSVRFISIKNSNKSFRSCFNVAYSERLFIPDAAADNEFLNRYFCVAKYYDSDKLKVMQHIRLKEYTREFWNVKNGEIASTGRYNGERFEPPFYDTPNKWSRTTSRGGISEPGMIYPGNCIEITRAAAELMNCERLKNMDLRTLFENNRWHTPEEIFKAVVKMPSIESMGKMGLYKIAGALIGSNVIEPINTGSPAKQLGVDRLVLTKFAEENISLNECRLWKEWRLTLNDWADFARLTKHFDYWLSEIDRLFKKYPFIKFGTLSRYLEKQSVSLTRSDTVTLFTDYLNMAASVHLDLEHDKNLLYPADLKKEHDKLSAAIEIKKNAENEANLAKRSELLNKLTFSDENFIISPLKNVTDFINESSVLSHCVKTYIERCAAGETNIFGLRKLSEPDVPYFTVNIDNTGRLIQNRGKCNCAPPNDVKQFVDRWLKFVKKTLRTISLDPKAMISVAETSKVRIGA